MEKSNKTKKETKKKKTKVKLQDLSKKQKCLRFLKYAVITVILSIIVYFGTSFITKKIMDAVNKSDASDGSHSILENLEKVDNITVSQFITNLNKNLQDESLPYQLKSTFQKTNNMYIYTLDKEKGIALYLEPVRMLQDQKKEVLKLTALFYPKGDHNTEAVQNIFRVLLKTNNEALNVTDIDQLINNVDSTENTTQKNDTVTSEFFQYKGLEVSKRSDDVSSSYRIGRIMNEE